MTLRRDSLAAFDSKEPVQPKAVLMQTWSNGISRTSEDLV